MAWSAPADKVTNDTITAAIWNSHMGTAGNSAYLKTQQDLDDTHRAATSSIHGLSGSVAVNTFVPTLLLGATPVTSYTYQEGNYVKIGNLVFISGAVKVNEIGGGTGNLTIGALPFTSIARSGNGHPISVICEAISNVTTQTLKGAVNQSSTAIGLFRYTAGSQQNSLTNADLTAFTYIGFCGVYPTA